MPIIVNQNGQLTQLSANHQHRSAATQELIGHKPGFLVRWGSTVFFLILLGIFGTCWFIQYPDIVVAKARLSCINAPKEVVAHTDGKLVKLTIQQGDTLQAGQILGYLESIADPVAVRQISQQADAISHLIAQNRTDEIIHFFPDYGHSGITSRLGELQASYQTFVQSFITFRDFLSSGFYIRKKEMLLMDLRNIQKLHVTLTVQKALLQQDVLLSDTTFSASASLLKDKVISASDYRTERSKLIGKQISLPQITASILSNEGQQNEKRKEMAELENQRLVQKNMFVQELQTLVSQVQAWELKYVLKAPVPGSVSFSGFLQEGQEVKSGQSLFYVHPQNTAYFVEMLVPQYNFGRVKPNQEVLLKFQAYPFEQYGAVIGIIDFVNKVPTDSGYLARVNLPTGLTTNYQKPLQYRDGLLAQADVVTENRRLLERFYYNTVKQFKR